MLPQQNAISPIRKQTYVPREISNRRRQDKTSPGKQSAVRGSQAHFRCSQWVIEGNTTAIGLEQLLMMKLLQEISIKKCTNRANTISNSKREKIKTVPKYSDRILKIFMIPTIEQTANTSFIIHSPSKTQKRIVSVRPMEAEIKSMKRTFRYNFLNKALHLKSHMSQDEQIVTPTVPNMLPITLRMKPARRGRTQVRTDMRRKKRLKARMKGILMSMANSVQDQALLKMDESVMTTVQNKMRTNNPVQKGLQGMSGEQSTRYSASLTSVLMVTELIVLYWQLLLIFAMHSMRPHERSTRMSCQLPSIDRMTTPSDRIVQLCLLSGRTNRSGILQLLEALLMKLGCTPPFEIIRAEIYPAYSQSQLCCALTMLSKTARRMQSGMDMSDCDSIKYAAQHLSSSKYTLKVYSCSNCMHLYALSTILVVPQLQPRSYALSLLLIAIASPVP